MPGPAPKPAGQRRRRNKAPVAATLTSSSKRGRAPNLPGSAKMLASTRDWWKTVWASPMAAHWIEADRPAVVRLAHLQDLVARELRGWTDRDDVGHLVEDDQVPELVRVKLGGAMVSVTLLAEMRQIEDRLGLTPMARKRLQWELEDETAAAPAARVPDEVEARRRERFSRAVGS